MGCGGCGGAGTDSLFEPAPAVAPVSVPAGVPVPVWHYLVVALVGWVLGRALMRGAK